MLVVDLGGPVEPHRDSLGGRAMGAGGKAETTRQLIRSRGMREGRQAGANRERRRAAARPIIASRRAATGRSFPGLLSPSIRRGHLPRSRGERRCRLRVRSWFDRCGGKSRVAEEGQSQRARLGDCAALALGRAPASSTAAMSTSSLARQVHLKTSHARFELSHLNLLVWTFRYHLLLFSREHKRSFLQGVIVLLKTLSVYSSLTSVSVHAHGTLQMPKRSEPE